MLPAALQLPPPRSQASDISIHSKAKGALGYSSANGILKEHSCGSNYPPDVSSALDTDESPCHTRHAGSFPCTHSSLPSTRACLRSQVSWCLSMLASSEMSCIDAAMAGCSGQVGLVSSTLQGHRPGAATVLPPRAFFYHLGG